MSVRNLNPVYICDRCHNERDSKMKKIAGMDICDCCEKELLTSLTLSLELVRNGRYDMFTDSPLLNLHSSNRGPTRHTRYSVKLY